MGSRYGWSMDRLGAYRKSRKTRDLLISYWLIRKFDVILAHPELDTVGEPLGQAQDEEKNQLTPCLVRGFASGIELV
jgi:hypothetical protein